MDSDNPARARLQCRDDCMEPQSYKLLQSHSDCSISLASGVRGLFKDHPAAANEDPRKGKDGGEQPEKHPKSLGEPPEPTEVQVG